MRAIYEYTAPNNWHETDYEDDEQELSVTVREDGRVVIAVTEEKAVGSYNDTFTCTIYLPPEEAAKLKAVLP